MSQGFASETSTQGVIISRYSDTFLVGNQSLQTFLKEKLSLDDKIKLESLISKYISQIETSLLSGEKATKNEVLGYKQKLYINLLPYIEVSKINQFKVGVEQDAVSLDSSGLLGYVGNDNEVIRESRVFQIQTQAQKNTEILRSQMQEKILSEVEKRLNSITLQEKFISLSSESKISLFEKFSSKLALQIKELQQKTTPTKVIEEKIFLYHGVLELLQKYIDSWK